MCRKLRHNSRTNSTNNIRIMATTFRGITVCFHGSIVVVHVIFAIPGAKRVVKASSNERSWRQPLVSLTTHGDGIERRNFHRSNDYRSSASKCDEALSTSIASNIFHMDCWVAAGCEPWNAPAGAHKNQNLEYRRRRRITLKGHGTRGTVAPVRVPLYIAITQN